MNENIFTKPERPFLLIFEELFNEMHGNVIEIRIE